MAAATGGAPGTAEHHDGGLPPRLDLCAAPLRPPRPRTRRCRNTTGDRQGWGSTGVAWTPAPLDAARGTDVLACEAYTYDRTVRYHLDYATILTHAESLATSRLILTHLGPSKLSRAHEAHHEIAHDGMTVPM